MGQLQREYFEALGRGLVAEWGHVHVGCAGKTAYRAFEADRVLAKLRKRGAGGRKAKIAAYRCFHCGQWHIGSRLENPAGETATRLRKSFTAAK